MERSTDQEVAAKKAQYKYACTFEKAVCKERFKTKAVIQIHYNACNFNYGLTKRKWEVEKIITVFGQAERKIFRVKWTGRSGEDSWQKEHSAATAGRMCGEHKRVLEPQWYQLGT